MYLDLYLYGKKILLKETEFKLDYFKNSMHLKDNIYGLSSFRKYLLPEREGK
jgi:hypothetical protein